MRAKINILGILMCLMCKASAFEEERCVPLGEKICVDDVERIVDGFRIKKCWKYEQQFKCISKEENNCAVFENNRGCKEKNVECKEEVLGKCKHAEKQFVCGDKTSENQEIKLVDSAFTVLKDEKDLSNCTKEEIDKHCKLAVEKCVEEAETRNIDGKDVYKDCWKWDRQYDCRTDTKIDECANFRNDPTCKETSRECIHWQNGVCEHYTVKYDCEHTKSEKTDCISAEFCVGGVCKEQVRSTNKNLGKAISALSVLTQVKQDGEGCSCKGEECEKQGSPSADTCKLFSGEYRKCLTNKWYNCCSDSGFVKKALGCSDEAKDLQDKNKAKLCTPIGSWKVNYKKVWSRAHSFCCFNSKLARIIQVEGRKQLGIGWGHKKRPDCRPLTLAEVQRIDFSKIDFSELYDELKSKATADFAKTKEEIKNTKLKKEDFSEGMSNKFKQFYGKAGNASTENNQ